MKTKGAIAYIGVPLKELNELYKEDAVIHVSKKFLNHYLMISSKDEEVKNVTLQKKSTSEREMAPPLEMKISDGDW